MTIKRFDSHLGFVGSREKFDGDRKIARKMQNVGLRRPMWTKTHHATKHGCAVEPVALEKVVQFLDDTPPFALVAFL